MAAPLTCHASHQEMASGQYPGQTFGEWRSRVKMVAAQNACGTIIQGKFIKRVDANLVLDVAFWVFKRRPRSIGRRRERYRMLNGGGRDPASTRTEHRLVNHPHLYLGVFDPNVDNYSGPRAMIVARTDLGTIAAVASRWAGTTSVFPTGRTSSNGGAGAVSTLCIGGEVLETRARTVFGTGKIPTT